MFSTIAALFNSSIHLTTVALMGASGWGGWLLKGLGNTKTGATVTTEAAAAVGNAIEAIQKDLAALKAAHAKATTTQTPVATSTSVAA